MRNEVKEARDEYVSELKRLFPGILVEVSAGSTVRIKAPSPQDVGAVLEKAAELQTQWYLNKGMYLKVSVFGSGPITG